MAGKVLWVEDEPETVHYERIWLQQRVDLTRVSNAEAAISAMASERYSLLILDFILPRNAAAEEERSLDADVGTELLRTLRSEDWRGPTPSSVPAIAYTAVISPERVSVIVSLLGDRTRYFSKPTDTEARQRFLNLACELASTDV